jgi:hypothetical protein
LTVGCGDDSKKPSAPATVSPTVSAQMAGVWHFTTTIRDCVTNGVISTDEYTDTLCVGESVGDASEENGCSLTREGGSYRSICDTTEPLGTGCNMRVHSNLLLTVTNTTVHGAGTVALSFEPAGCEPGIEGTCEKIDVTGNRIGPGGCGKQIHRWAPRAGSMPAVTATKQILHSAIRTIWSSE